MTGGWRGEIHVFPVCILLPSSLVIKVCSQTVQCSLYSEMDYILAVGNRFCCLLAPFYTELRVGAKKKKKVERSSKGGSRQTEKPHQQL